MTYEEILNDIEFTQFFTAAEGVFGNAAMDRIVWDMPANATDLSDIHEYATINALREGIEAYMTPHNTPLRVIMFCVIVLKDGTISVGQYMSSTEELNNLSTDEAMDLALASAVNALI